MPERRNGTRGGDGSELSRSDAYAKALAYRLSRARGHGHRPARPNAFAPPIQGRAHASHKFHKFAFRHGRDLFDLPLIPYGDFGFYGGYYDPSDDADAYPPYPAVYGPGSAAADRVGRACRSEEVTVPGSNGPVRVTVTRC